MKGSQQIPGLGWYLGTIQYCVCLFVGGALWFLIARVTGFFGGDLIDQVAACFLLLALIGAEAAWSHMPTAGSQVGDYIVDVLSSAAIAVFGMAIVLAILTWVGY